LYYANFGSLKKLCIHYYRHFAKYYIAFIGKMFLSKIDLRLKLSFITVDSFAIFKGKIFLK